MRGLIVGDYWLGQKFNSTEIPLGEWELVAFDLSQDEIKVISGRWKWTGPLEEFKKIFYKRNAIPQS